MPRFQMSLGWDALRRANPTLGSRAMVRVRRHARGASVLVLLFACSSPPAAPGDGGAGSAGSGSAGTGNGGTGSGGSSSGGAGMDAAGGIGNAGADAGGGVSAGGHAGGGGSAGAGVAGSGGHGGAAGSAGGAGQIGSGGRRRFVQLSIRLPSRPRGLKRDGLTGSNIVARRAPTGTQWETIDSYGLPGGVVFCLGLGIDGSGRFVVATTSGVYRSTPCPTCI
jgi:hypothetical protein